MSKRIKVGVTHGDVNGVGYEILLKTFSKKRMLELLHPIVYGSIKSASYYRKVLKNNPVDWHVIAHAENSVDGKVNLLNCVKGDVKVEIGIPSLGAGEMAYTALDAACRDLSYGKIDLLVTLPVNKHTIQHSRFRFPGHTEFLEKRFAVGGQKALMIMISEVLRVALVTTHTPLSEVPSQLSRALIVEKLKCLDHSLKRDFRVENPRIAVLGLNPHAGENGLLGREESEIIVPAIEEAQELDILCVGAFPADGFFGSGRFKEFDAVLAMYHDQGLIPFKTLSMGSGVNYTAGLPIVRTSPDHGTAYDIAGKNRASDRSFRQAIFTGMEIFRNRRAYDEAHRDPLKKLFFDRGTDDEVLDLMSDEDIL
ncbi:MAG: 4-hydroxythreonine-4-phosphate dehydrogenase PdxA [Proteiniphilum sp.]|jgi:4-hydroxythreonine-4-phosphate dehydrogenase|nr:4-hydroxythreonine-4-phosphate dehydrogenase PdxA [Proteiniphilum sp.]